MDDRTTTLIRPKAYSREAAPGHDAMFRKAHDDVNDRGQRYGESADMFGRVARRWELHFFNRYGSQVQIDPHDVAMMMMDLDLARLESAPQATEAWISAAGNAVVGGNLPGKPR